MAAKKTASRRKAQEPRASDYAREAFAEWRKAIQLAGRSVTSNESSSGSQRGKASESKQDEERPGEYAREALTEWGKAVRYAAAALVPMTKRATDGAKSAVARKAADANQQSLTDRLNPAKTEKGGRVGDAADALLAQLGGPGKMASKVSLGSRLVDRMVPDVLLEGLEPEEDAPPEVEAEEPEAREVAGEEPAPASAGDQDQAEPADDDEDADDDAPDTVQQTEPQDADAAPDPEEPELDYERGYEARHDRRPPNAYPQLSA